MKEISDFIVSVHDEDAFCNMKASAILKRMQECADMHLRRCVMPNGEKTIDEMAARKRGFILCKMNMAVFSPLHAYDKIRVESWVKEEKGVVIERLYKVFCKDVLVAEGAANWAIIENASKIVRVSEYANDQTHDDDVCSISVPKRFTVPDDVEMHYAGEKTILYSDIDLNGHMNNTNYPDMYMSFLPELSYVRGTGQKGMYISGMLINFAAEAPLGEVIKVYSGRKENEIYFRTVREDGKINTEARIMLQNA